MGDNTCLPRNEGLGLTAEGILTGPGATAVLTLAVQNDHFSYCQTVEETDLCKGEGRRQGRVERWLPGAGEGRQGGAGERRVSVTRVNAS